MERRRTTRRDAPAAQETPQLYVNQRAADVINSGADVTKSPSE